MAKGGKGASQRQLRVGELVRHALAEVLLREGLNDPEIDPTQVSISEVRMSPDLKIATAFVAPLATGADAEVLSRALARHAKFIRGRAAPHLSQMRAIPNFRFRPDTSFDNFAKIDALLRSPQVARDLDRDDLDRHAGGDDDGTS